MAENIIAYCKCSSIFRRFLKRLKRKKMRDLSALRQISHAITMQQTVSPVRDKTFSFVPFHSSKYANRATGTPPFFHFTLASIFPRARVNIRYSWIIHMNILLVFEKVEKKKKKKGGGHERSRRKRNMEGEAPRFEEASRLVLRSFFPPSNVISDSSSWSSIARTWKILYLWQDSAHVIDLSSNVKTRPATDF